MYKLIFDHLNNCLGNAVERQSDKAQIPFDPQNIDYQEYLEWLAEGNEPLPADAPAQENVNV